MSISALGSLAQSLVPGKSAQQVSPAYGLAFRFTVSVDGLELGSWQACSGLSVDFQPMAVQSGGQYLGTRYLAGEAKYGRVVLKRAASLSSSKDVQEWLAVEAQTWLEDPGTLENGVTAVITLFDSNDAAVMRWTLSGVRPAAWKGPDLDASSSKVAVEVLELVHEGFTVTPGSGPQGAAHPPGTPSRNKLVLTGPGGTVEFPFAPVKVTVARSHDAAVVTGGSTVGGQPVDGSDSVTATSGLLIGGKPNTTSYSFNNLVLHGANVKRDVDMLLAWSTKPQSATQGNPALPLLRFSFGPVLKGEGLVLTSVTASYTRFTAEGAPNRAMVATLKLEEPKPPRQGGGATSGSGGAPSRSAGPRRGARNPTSGGIPGRAVHVLQQPESLVSLAQDTYGDAGAWRDIADANGIDDPLRVRPGTRVFLPSRTEMEPR